MNENGRSWFYLTLWHGTPPEFTSEFDAQIADADSASAFIHTASVAESNIETAASYAANIRSRDAVGAEITTVTEVVWRVH